MSGPPRSGGPERHAPSLADVRARHDARLMALEGVVGVADGETDDGRACIKVYVASGAPSIRSAIPRQLDGYPVVVEATGEFHTQ
ncbi:MAG: hypothetical protein AB7Q17_11195 [Phycisphaerae bacterium]